MRGTLHLSLDRARGRGEDDAKRNLAAVDLQIFDKAKRDDVFVQIRIFDLAQGIKHYIFTQLRHERIMPKGREVCRTTHATSSVLGSFRMFLRITIDWEPEREIYSRAGW